MSKNPSTSEPTLSASHFPKWAALLNAPADQEEALQAFLRMARADVIDLDESHPTIRAKNYSASTAHPYRVRFDLREPDPVAEEEGDQDTYSSRPAVTPTTGPTRAIGGHKTTIRGAPSELHLFLRHWSLRILSIECGASRQK